MKEGMKGWFVEQVLQYGKFKRRRIGRKVLILGVVVAALAAGATIFWERGFELAARWQGRWEADRQWSTGTATIYVAGSRSPYDDMDVTTGLPFESIAGCTEVTREVEARWAGHNDRILSLIARDGAPAYSWLIREPGTADLSATWKSRLAKGDTPIRAGDHEVNVACGAGVRIHRVQLLEGYISLLVDGKEIRHYPMDTVEVMGGVSDDNMLYLRETNKDWTTYIVMETDGSRMHVVSEK